MADSTPNQSFPIMGQNAASKYVTYNTLARRVDVLLSASVLRVLDDDLTAPPGSPSDGDIYIVVATATGDWAGQENKIAYYNFNTWQFFSAASGWVAYIVDESTFKKFDGTNWVNFNDVIQNATLLGVNATADTTNKFVVASSATLFNHVGNGHQQKINKAVAGDTASQMFQTGFSSRAEYGLITNDDFTLKVSPDGSAWYNSFIVDKDSGLLQPQQGISFDNGTNILDQYEEGTWTPILYGSSVAGSPTYSVNSGAYTRIGDRCFGTGYIALSNIGGMTGQIRIDGLPFNLASDILNRSAIQIAYIDDLNTSYSDSFPFGFLVQGLNDIYLYNYVSGNAASLLATDIQNTFTINFSFQFKVA